MNNSQGRLVDGDDAFGRHRFRNPGITTDNASLSNNGTSSQNGGSRIDGNIVLDGGVALAAALLLAYT